MQRIVAACGLVCTECEAYAATQAEDADAIAAIAAAWSQRYRVPFTPDDVWCDGCASASPRTSHHCRDCPIRPCARGRGFTSCAECGDYRCEQLRRVHQLAPQAHEVLESIRQGEHVVP